MDVMDLDTTVKLIEAINLATRLEVLELGRGKYEQGGWVLRIQEVKAAGGQREN